MNRIRTFAIVAFSIAGCLIIAGAVLAGSASKHHPGAPGSNAGYTLMAIGAVAAVIGAVPLAAREWHKHIDDPEEPPDTSPTETSPSITDALRAAGVEQHFQRQQAEAARQVQKMRENQ